MFLFCGWFLWPDPGRDVSAKIILKCKNGGESGEKLKCHSWKPINLQFFSAKLRSGKLHESITFIKVILQKRWVAPIDLEVLAQNRDTN